MCHPLIQIASRQTKLSQGSETYMDSTLLWGKEDTWKVAGVYGQFILILYDPNLSINWAMPKTVFKGLAFTTQGVGQTILFFTHSLKHLVLCKQCNWWKHKNDPSMCCLFCRIRKIHVGFIQVFPPGKLQY